MATWRKSPAELVAAFDAALAHQPHAERRQMFGYPCAFVNGNMAIGLHEDRVIARVPGECDSRPCIMLGRRMKDYAAVDYDTVMADGAMAQWVARAVAHTGRLPPKAAKVAKAAKAGKTAPPAKATREPATKRAVASVKRKSASKPAKA